MLVRPGPGTDISAKPTPKASASVTPSDRLFEVSARKLPATSQLAVRSVTRPVAPSSDSLKGDLVRQLKQKSLETDAERKWSVSGSEGSRRVSPDGSRLTLSTSSTASTGHQLSVS